MTTKKLFMIFESRHKDQLQSLAEHIQGVWQHDLDSISYVIHGSDDQATMGVPPDGVTAMDIADEKYRERYRPTENVQNSLNIVIGAETPKNLESLLDDATAQMEPTPWCNCGDLPCDCLGYDDTMTVSESLLLQIRDSLANIEEYFVGFQEEGLDELELGA